MTCSSKVLFLTLVALVIIAIQGRAKGIFSSQPVNDSIKNADQKISENPPDLDKSAADSINSIFWQDLFYGFGYYNARRNELYSTNSPLEMFNFNTVEGFYVNLGLKYNKGNARHRWFSSETYFRYGFSNKRFNAKSSLKWSLSPVKKCVIEIGGGRYVNQFNNSNPIHPFVNSYYSLFHEKNYLKAYGSNFGRLRYEHEIFEGVILESGVLYEDREPLSNTTGFSLVPRIRESDSVYSSNDPTDFAGIEDKFTRHQALVLDVRLKIKFRDQVISAGDKRLVLSSEYPDITLRYEKGVKALGSDVNYNFGGITVNQHLDYGFFGKSSWIVEAGTFFSVKDIEFIDFHHFNGNQTGVTSFAEPLEMDKEPLRSFFLLDYYDYSTRTSFWTVRFNHHFRGFITKKIPLLNKTGIESVIGLSFLQTSDDVLHFEFSTGLENVFRLFRIDFVMGLNTAEKVRHGVRLSLLLNNL